MFLENEEAIHMENLNMQTIKMDYQPRLADSQAIHFDGVDKCPEVCADVEILNPSLQTIQITQPL